MASQPKPPIAANREALLRLLDHRPILWVGDGLSIRAGHPSTDELIRSLCASADDQLDATREFTELVDALVASEGQGALRDLLGQECDGAARQPTDLHRVLARLAGTGAFAAIFTSNRDALIEDALEAESVAHVVHTAKQNADLRTGALRVVKVHGSHTDWANALQSGESRAAFDRKYSFLLIELDQLMQQSPIVFVGCSMRDPRLLSWLTGLPEERAAQLERWRPMMRQDSWERAVSDQAMTLARGNIRPLVIEDHEQLLRLWQATLAERAPRAGVPTDRPTATDQSGASAMSRDRPTTGARSWRMLALLVALALAALFLWRSWPSPAADDAGSRLAGDAGIPRDSGARDATTETIDVRSDDAGMPIDAAVIDALRSPEPDQPDQPDKSDKSDEPDEPVDAAPPPAIDAASRRPPRWTVTRVERTADNGYRMFLQGPTVRYGFMRLVDTADDRRLRMAPRCRVEAGTGPTQCLLLQANLNKAVVGDQYMRE